MVSIHKDYNLINRAIKLQNGANAHDLLTLVAIYQNWHTNLRDGLFKENKDWCKYTQSDLIKKIQISEIQLREFVCAEEKKCLNFILN